MFNKLLLSIVFSLSLTVAIAQPQEAKDLYYKGTDHVDFFEYEEAIEALKKAIAIDPKYVDALYELGFCYNETKKYKDAIVVLEKAVKVDPKFAKVYFELGYAYDLTDQFETALKHYNKYLELRPEDRYTYRNIGDVYYITYKYADALANYEKYFTAPKVDSGYYYKAGWCANDLGKHNEALAYFEKYNPTKDDDKAKKAVEIGYAHYKLKNNDKALDSYNKALSFKPNYGSALSGLGNVNYYNLANQAEAIKYYELALKHDEANMKALYYTLGYLYNDNSRYDDAINILLKGVEYEPKYVGVREELGYAYYMKTNTVDAEIQLKKAIELDPKGFLGYYYLGLCYNYQGKKDEAKKMAEKLKTVNKDYSVKLLDKINAK